MLQDQHTRQKAIDVSKSFIVQAPAGSGKTELLTQRYLALLAHSRAPEEIVAITFTRKASAEMQARIMRALSKATLNIPPNSEHERATLKLARAVLQKDLQAKWYLLENPQRLRIATIDALCASISKQVPLESGISSDIQVLEDAELIYKKAIRSLLADLNTDLPWQQALSTILLHLDNQIEQFEDLLMHMLAKREQWLDIIQSAKQQHNLRDMLEDSLQHIVKLHLQSLGNIFPKQHLPELLRLMKYSADNRGIALWKDVTELKITEEHLKYWDDMIQVLLTKDSVWRKKPNKSQGFPTVAADKNTAKEFKEAVQDLLKEFFSVENLESALADIKFLPDAYYTDAKWKIVDSLLEILPVLVAHLHLIFNETGQTDFSEIAISALQAFGSNENPTDLALRFDYQIKHILVDEFQDTSQLQHSLLLCLTAGWQNQDGRSLFLVGDPMQSIYRFRQADVGLFMQIKQYGLGDIQLEALTLSANFRSHKSIIDWLNEHFVNIFPKDNDYLKGAVSYTSCLSATTHFDENDQTLGVDCKYIFSDMDFPEYAPKAEADVVFKRITQLLDEKQDENIAVLVRSRSHLKDLLALLQLNDVKYQAIDIEKLIDRGVIQDLLALSFALHQLADKLAWLSILRAPWCGLELKDLLIISQHSHNQTVWETLQDASVLKKLNAHAQTVLDRIIPILGNCLLQRRRFSLREWVEATWWALGGVACVKQKIDIKNASIFFNLLQELSIGEALPERDILHKKLYKLHACTPASTDTRLQIMTVHKSKGLEFDNVILFGLNKRIRHEERPLLLWQEYMHSDARHLLIAPIQARDEISDKTYTFLHHDQQQKSFYESQRLLYVAATRAKKRLFLFTTLQYKAGSKTLQSPISNSLWYHLWPNLKDLCEQEFSETEDLVSRIDFGSLTNNAADKNTEQAGNMLERLPKDWKFPEGIAGYDVGDITAKCKEAIKINTENQQKSDKNIPTIPAADSLIRKSIGSVIHRFLAKIANDGLTNWSEETINNHTDRFAEILRQYYLPPKAISSAQDKVKQA
ncbi:MAG: hypothetical protein COB50_02300, partial [Thiotrichales bacterium]